MTMLCQIQKVHRTFLVQAVLKNLILNWLRSEEKSIFVTNHLVMDDENDDNEDDDDNNSNGNSHLGVHIPKILLSLHYSSLSVSH